MYIETAGGEITGLAEQLPAVSYIAHELKRRDRCPQSNTVREHPIGQL